LSFIVVGAGRQTAPSGEGFVRARSEVTRKADDRGAASEGWPSLRHWQSCHFCKSRSR